MSEGFKKRVVKSQLSEAEIEAKTAEFASKADTDPVKVAVKNLDKTAQREIRFTVRMNEYEQEQLEKICAATGFNKVVAVRQALKEYANKVCTE
jgi:hypothetical protein